MEAALAPDLETLIRDELRPIVQELVGRLVVELVAEELSNGRPLTTRAYGAGAAPRPTAVISEAPESQPKVCRVCGRQDVRFDQGRRVCQGCRSRQQAERDRAREQTGDDEEPHPADPVSKATPSRGRRGSHRRNRDQFWSDRRRALIERARSNGVTRELRDGREFIVVRLQSQFAPPQPSP